MVLKFLFIVKIIFVPEIKESQIFFISNCSSKKKEYMASFFIGLDTVGVEKITNPIFRSLFIIRVLRDRSRSLRRNNLYEKNKKFGYPC